MMSFNVMLILGGVLSLLISGAEVDIEKFPSWRLVAIGIAIGILFSVHRYFSIGNRYLKLLQSFDASDSKFCKRPGIMVALSFSVSLVFLFSVWLAIFMFGPKNF
jgi:hypothetical protein